MTCLENILKATALEQYNNENIDQIKKCVKVCFQENCMEINNCEVQIAAPSNKVFLIGCLHRLLRLRHYKTPKALNE